MQEDLEITMLRRRVNVNHTDFNLEYDLGGTIGQGTFGKVKKATDKQRSAVVAVKMLGGRNFGTNELRAFLNECDILAEIDHSNVPKLHGIYECNRKYTMIMEYASGGELFERIQAQGSFNEEAAANITRQLLSVLQYIHDKRIAHRDLKPENILFADCERDLAKATVKLIDFGFAKRMTPGGSGAPEVSRPVITQNSFQTRLGSPNYVAPEILTSKIGYGVEVDVWSLGVILYIMLCGYFPFYHENERELYRQIRKGSFDMPSEDWSHVSDAAKDLVNSMLKTDPRLRASASDCLRHPWVAKPGVASKQPFPQASRDKLDLFLDSQKKSTKLRKVMDKVLHPFRHSPKKSEQVGHGHVQNKSNLGPLEMSLKKKTHSKGKGQQQQQQRPSSSSEAGAESQESITSPLYSQYGITHSALPKKTGCTGNCTIQ
jgi:serine/threonine protein kinase